MTVYAAFLRASLGKARRTYRVLDIHIRYILSIITFGNVGENSGIQGQLADFQPKDKKFG